MARPGSTGTLALVLVALVGCGSVAESPGRVVVLGVDGLHLPLLDQLVAAGRLPNFGRLLLPPGHTLLPRRKEPHPRLVATAAPDGGTAADPAIIRRLRALGYVD
jgi:hypothetical protein